MHQMMLDPEDASTPTIRCAQRDRGRASSAESDAEADSFPP